MDFDEYDYLEKSVDQPDAANGSNGKNKDGGIEKSEKGYRRREKAQDDDEEDRVEKKSKKSRGEEENGGERKREREERERDRDRVRDIGRDRDRDRERSSRHRRDGDRDRDRHRSSRVGERERERSSKERERERRGREGDKERERVRRSKERGRSKERERSKDREKSKERERSKDRERSKERSKERERSRSSRRSRSPSRIEQERSRRSRSRSRIEREKEMLKERERELELRESRRFKDKKEVVEPEADPERDQRTVFAYQMPLKAAERDVYEFFSKAGKVRDVRLIMDRNSRRSKGVGYIEFYDAMSVPMAIALSGHLLLGQPVMVKPSEAEKNLVQSNASTGGSGGLVGPYGAVDRKLYVGNLHFNMTEFQLKQIFEAFGAVELVQLPTDPESGHCKGFGFVQFHHLEHAKAAQSLNGKLEIAGRTIKVSSVTDHVGAQDSGAKAADFDDDDGGGLALNAQSRALLMQKLDRSGTATSFAGSLGAPVLNGSTPVQQSISMPINGAALPAFPAQIVTPVVSEPIGNPSECLLLKNMFDPTTEEDPEFDLDIKDDVQEECSNYGRVQHIHVDKNSAGYVYLRFENVEGASRAQQAMHKRWFARRLISAIFLQPYEYDAKFNNSPLQD